MNIHCLKFFIKKFQYIFIIFSPPNFSCLKPQAYDDLLWQTQGPGHARKNVHSYCHQFLLEAFLSVLIDLGKQNVVLVGSITYRNNGYLHITGALEVLLKLLWNCMIKLLLKYHKSVYKCVYYSKPQIWFRGTWRNNVIAFLCNICHLSIYYLYNVCIISSLSFLQWVLIILIYPHPTPTPTRSILPFSTQITWWFSFFFTTIFYCSNIIGYVVFRWHVMNLPRATFFEETLSSLLSH